ncbi:MAG: tetratricopeptide repeat protein, partial [Kibdelosporangium sp.]
HGAHHLALDTLTDDEARALLCRRLGAARVAAEPQPVAELVGLCGGLPLALGIIAGRAHTHPRVPLAEFAADLRGLGLGALDDDDPATGLTSVLSWSYHALTTQQQVVFGLLGIAPGPDISLPAAASLTGLPPTEAARMLRGLQESSLLDRNTHSRYSMHDLIRRYATDTAHYIPDDVREAALRRVVDFYLHTAFAADRLLNPHRPPIQLDQPAPGAHPHPLADGSVALAWLDIHHLHLLAAQHAGAVHHRHQTVWQLAWTLTIFHQRRGRLHDNLAVWQTALRAASHLPDPTCRIHSHRFLGSAHAELERHEQAIDHLHQALALAEHQGNRIQQAHTHLTLATAWQRQGDARQALDHARRALDFFRTLDQPVWEAEALNLMGWHAAHLGEYETARHYCQTALVLLRRHDDPHGEAAVLDSLGYVEHHSGRQDQAIHHYGHALTLYRTLGHSYEVANTLDNLGHPHTALGHHTQAREAWREALELYRDQGRNDDAARVQRQLDDLNTHDNGDQPPPTAESAN